MARSSYGIEAFASMPCYRKFTVTLLAAVILTVQLAGAPRAADVVDEAQPLQLRTWRVASGCAVKVTVVFPAKRAFWVRQVVPQLIPLGLLVTEPYRALVELPLDNDS